MSDKQIDTLTAKNLMKRYGARKVVRDVSVSVKSGEVVGLLGPNGAGKTTTFYMIVGLVPPNGGDILLNDNPITHLPIFKRARLGVSYLPQEASVFRKLTVEDNIRAILELQYDKTGARLSRTEIEKRLNNLLDELQIQHIRTNTALSLSGGERRRTEIARALAADPRFILLDEPFAGVDPIAVIEIQRIVRFLRIRFAYHRTVLVIIADHAVSIQILKFRITGYRIRLYRLTGSRTDIVIDLLLCLENPNRLISEEITDRITILVP